MEKRRIRLEINGVVLGLVTEESDEYVDALAGEVGDLMRDIQEASPYITREAAALTAALSYCDDLKRSARQSRDLQERVDELRRRAAALEDENAALRETAEKALEAVKPAPAPEDPAGVPAQPASPPVKKHRGNPMRYEDQLDQLGLVSFFEQDHEDK